jgi:hypothetical protein
VVSAAWEGGKAKRIIPQLRARFSCDCSNFLLIGAKKIEELQQAFARITACAAAR